jgi:hypothetical protein
MLFKSNEFNDGIGKLAIRPGWQLDPGTRTPPGGRVRRPDYLCTPFDYLRRHSCRVLSRLGCLVTGGAAPFPTQSRKYLTKDRVHVVVRRALHFSL